MKKEAIRKRIEANECVTYGCISFYRRGTDYFYGRRAEKEIDDTEVFGNFNDLWAEIGHYFLFGVDREAAALAPLPEANPEPGLENENQNERWIRIHNLKLCKCGARISVDQKTCSFCFRWTELDRNHRYYIRTHTSISPYDRCLITAKQRRLITKRQEQILQLCHHDFGGLTQAEAAGRLGISQQTIQESLEYVKKVLPQYFPIFTKFEMKCYHYYMVDGWSVNEIAEYVEHAPHTIYRALQRVRSKGAYFAGPTGRVLSYDESMDGHIKQKF